MAVRGKPGDQFVTLYRGLVGTTPEEVEQVKAKGKPLGIHWTKNPNVAYNFAVGNTPSGYPDNDVLEVYDPEGVVIAAKVHKRHILDPDSSEWSDYSDAYSIFGPNSDEEESTLRKGAIVHVEKMSHVSADNERLVDPQTRRGWRA
jgi:hypothetical protein